MGLEKSKRPQLAPAYLEGPNADPVGGGGGGSANWWDQPNTNVVSKAVFQDGDLIGYYGQAPQVQAGTADGSGLTGAGGHTDLEVGCSIFFDTSPSANAGRGWVVFDQNIRADNDHHCRISARFPAVDEDHFTLGYHPGNTLDDPNAKVTDGSAFFYKRDIDGNWIARSANGTTGEETDTGVAWDGADWHNFEVHVFNDEGTMTAVFYIDGVEVARHTTSVPTAAGIMGQLSCRAHLKTAGVSTFSGMFCNGYVQSTRDSSVLENLGFAVL